MNQLLQDYRYLVLTGNYGSGKTELALNLAMKYAQNYRTTLVDLYIVNPYFRTERGREGGGDAPGRCQDADADLCNDYG